MVRVVGALLLVAALSGCWLMRPVEPGPNKELSEEANF